MKKTTKNIIIALAVLLVLGIAAAVLMLTGTPADEETESSSSASSEAEKLIDHSITEVKSVVVECAETGDSLTLIPTKEDEDSEENDTFTIQGWEDEPVLTSNVQNLAMRFYSITPSKEIGTVQNLSEYGLDGDGEYKGTVTYTDGSKDIIIIGREAGETYGRYILYHDLVYIAPVSTYLTKSRYEFIDTAVIAIPNPTEVDADGNETEGQAELESLHLSGTNYEQEIRMGLSDDEVLAYDITEPIYAGANSGKVDTIIEQLQNVTASGVVAVKATDEEIEKYGLDEPVAVAEYQIAGEKHTIRLGEKTGSLYGMMIDDNTTIYTISESSVDSWANASIYELRDGFIRLPYIKSVQKLTVTAADGTDVYDIERIVDEERSTESTPYYNLEVTKDGKTIDYDNYQPFYQMLLSVSLLNEEIREPEGDPVLTVRYDYFNGNSEEISFYADPNAERRYVVTLNGQPTGAVRSTDVEKILAAKPTVAENKPIKEESES
ncbi:MAG: DUF4340 domain-containing protein [Hominenteromicrobium sp.]